MTQPFITGTVVGAAVVQKSLLQDLLASKERLRSTIKALGFELADRVKRDKLLGQVLNRRSGRLGASINSRFLEDGEDMESRVGTGISYGRRWELGFVGTENVRAFARRTKGGGIAQVRAHSRRVNQKARPFLAPTLEEMKPYIYAKLQAAIDL